MAIFSIVQKKGKCPKCESRNVEVDYRKFDITKDSTITKKWIKCNDCGYEG